MKIVQVSVFLENRKGRLSEVCELLGKSGINIRALNVAESADFGVLRIVVDKPDEAAKALKGGGFVATLTEIVPVEVPDKPGGLAGVLKVLSQAGINVEYMYGFVQKFSENALLVFRFEDPEAAKKVLHKHGIKVVSPESIVKL